MTKVCSRCKAEKVEEDFYLRKDKRKPKAYRDSWCKACRLAVQRDRREAHPEVHRAANQDWKSRHPERVREINRNSRRRVTQERRLAFLVAQGGRCECCGETNPHFLTIDHIGKRPPEHKGLGGMALIARIEATDYARELWQILCWNCNCAKGRYGACPHQENFVPYYAVAA